MTWRQGAAARRDDRNVKASDAPKSVGLSSKDTKRWCQGKTNVEHKPKVYPMTGIWSNSTKAERPLDLCCETCGRKLDFYYPRWGNTPTGQKKPEWVIAYEKEEESKTSE
jgi:hypothetical protein